MSQMSCIAVYILMILLRACSNARHLSGNDGFHHMTSVSEQCRETMTNKLGLLIFSSKSLLETGLQICAIRVDGAESLHLMFRRERTEFNESIRNVSYFLHVAIYGHKPDDNELPLNVWRGEENNYAKEVLGSELWLVINIKLHHVTQNIHDLPNFYWSIAYAAQINNKVPECDISRLYPPENGILDVGSYAFGSVVNLKCSEGYNPIGGQVYAVCSMAEGVLSWIRYKSICSLTCNHPPIVHHAIAYSRTEYFIDNSNSNYNGEYAASSPTRTNTTISYVCQKPYVAEGSDTISCGYDSKGIPHWSNTPPTCISSSFSTSSHLLQFTGTIPTPSYPNNTLVSTSLKWLWEISGPKISHIQLNVTNIDLPKLPSVGISIYDVATGRPRQLVHLTGQSEPVSISCETSRVIVIFQGPPVDVRCHKGFFVQYLFKSKMSRVRRRRSMRSAADDEPSPMFLGTVETGLETTTPTVSSQDTLKGLSVMSTEESTTLNSTGVSENLTSATTILTEQMVTDFTVSSSKNNMNTGDSSKHSTEVTTDETTENRKITELSTTTMTNGPPNTTLFQSTLTHTEQSTQQSLENTTRKSTDQSTETSPREFNPISTKPSTGQENDTELSTVQSFTITVQLSTGDLKNQTIFTSTEQPIQYSTQNVINTSTEQIVTSTQYAINSSTVPLAETSTERTINASTEELTSTEQFTGQPIIVSSDTPTEGHHDDASTTPEAEESNDDWKIAVGVVIPILFLVAVLVGVYICYRKKYPVRMIIGREFGKFTNPNYVRRDHAPSLVREDADFYFSNRTSSNVSSQDFNPINTKRVYDNMGFTKDEGDDEDEKERKFLQSKSWLFKKTTSESETSEETRFETIAESSFIIKSKPLTAQGSVPKKTEKKIYTENDILEILADEKPRPVAKPRLKKKLSTFSKSDESSSSNKDQPDENANVVTSGIYLESSSLPRSSVLTDISEQENINEASSNINEASSNIKRTMELFQKPSFDEVWADVKARSKSLSIDYGSVNSRTRSFSVDPSKSARKMSLRDDVLLSSRSKSDASNKLTSRDDDVNKVSAFVVGVDIRDRQASTTSSVLVGEDSFEFAQEQQERRLLSNSLDRMFRGDIFTYRDESESQNHYRNLEESLNTKSNIGYYNGNTILDEVDSRAPVHDSILQKEVDDPNTTFVSTSRIILESIHERQNVTSVPSALKLISTNTGSIQDKAETQDASPNSESFVSDVIIRKNIDNNIEVKDQYDDLIHSLSEDPIKQFDIRSPDRKVSESSTESVIGSLHSSLVVSSDDEDKITHGTYSDNMEGQYQKQYDKETDPEYHSLDEERRTNLLDTSVFSPPSLHFSGSVEEAASATATPETHFHRKGDISKLQFSDSSSDSSDILPNKKILTLSRKPLSSDYMATDTDYATLHSVDAYKNLSGESSGDEYHANDDNGYSKDVDVEHAMYTIGGKPAYRFREDRHDDDVDV